MTLGYSRKISYLVGMLVCIVCGLSIILRAWKLDHRPMHTDEAVHAVKFSKLLDEGVYQYDPREYHGPTLYYATLPFAWLTGETDSHELTEKTLRLVAVFSYVLILVPLLFMRKLVPNVTAPLATLFAATSPLLFYYSRYYIHELFLVAFFFGFIVSCWRYVADRRWYWAVAAGVSVGLALATKETIALSGMAMVGALALLVVTEKGVWTAFRAGLNWKHVGYALLAMVAVAVLFYSSFFTHWSGVTDFMKTYYYYLNRAGGQGHDKPWYYYLKIMVYFKNGPGFTAIEPMVFLLGIGSVIIAFFSSSETPCHRYFLKFLSSYSLLLFIIYSSIPYKMPWLAQNWIQPMTVLAAITVLHLFSLKRNWLIRIPLILVVSMATLHQCRQIYWENTRLSADIRNPYVYSHTTRNFLQLPRLVNKLSALHPDKRDMVIHAVAEEYWPLPWYLRHYTNVGYWHTNPDIPVAPIVITSESIMADMDPQLKDTHVTFRYGLRYGVDLYVHIEKGLWRQFTAKGP